MTPVNPDKLHDVWDWVKAGLEDLAKKHNTEWRPEDVYTALKTPAAQTALYTIGDGFLIARRQVQFCGPVLFVWVIYGPNALVGLKQEIQEEVDALARSIGAKKIVMHSPRRGWERWGYKPREIIYERSI